MKRVAQIGVGMSTVVIGIKIRGKNTDESDH